MQASGARASRSSAGLYADRQHRRRRLLALANRPPEALREGAQMRDDTTGARSCFDFTIWREC